MGDLKGNPAAPWDIGWAGYGFESAEIAKIRLHGIVAQDRKACEDGKWTLIRKKNSWRAYVFAELGRWEDAAKISKDLYRWAVRR